MSRKLDRVSMAKRRSQFEAQAKRIRSKEEAGVSFLAAGVAHEFNNLLGAAHGHARWALDSGSVDDMRAALEVVELVCERSASITKALQNFAQPKEENFQTVNLSDIVLQALQIEAADLKAAGALVHFSPQKHLVQADSGAILEVILNLIRNSLDAFCGLSSAKVIEIRFLKSQQRLRMLFSDNGPGVSGLHRDQIFNAFWTTKGVLKNVQANSSASVAKGSVRGSAGLGLFLARRVMREHGGELGLLSTSKKGAHFYLDFPARALKRSLKKKR